MRGSGVRVPSAPPKPACRRMSARRNAAGDVDGSGGVEERVDASQSLGAALHVEAQEDVLEVLAYGRVRQSQRPGDLRVARSGGHLAQDLPLPRRQVRFVAEL